MDSKSNNTHSSSSLFSNITIKDPVGDEKSTWKNIEVKNLANRASRSSHTATLVDGNMIVFGGEEVKGNILINFDLKKQSCQQIEVTGRERKALFVHSTCYWKENKFVVFGGLSGDSAALSEVGIITLSESTATWETVKTEGKLFRAFHTAHIYKNRMYVIGGHDETKTVGNRVWYLDLVTMKWEEPEMNGDVPKYGLKSHSSVLYGNKIYVFYSVIRGGSIDTFATIDLDTLTWETLNSEGFPVLQKNIICSQQINGQVYLFGGDEEASTPNELRCFNLQKNKWIEVEQAGKSIMKRTKATLIAFNNHLYLFGGFNKKRNAFCHGFWIFPLDENALGSPRDEASETEEQESMSLPSVMKMFFKEAPYSDIIFEVEDQEIPAHKWWLINRSKYFANMFSSGMIESKTNKIPVRDIQASTFRAFLEFIYSDNVKMNEELAIDLLKLADMYSVPDLKIKCEEYLISILKFQNYLKIAKVAEWVDSENLKKAAITYMVKEIKRVKAQKDFDEISDDYIRGIILKLTIKGS